MGPVAAVAAEGVALAGGCSVTAWFGPAWDAPVCEDTPQAPVPVGQPCLACSLPIEEDDQGFLIPYAPETGYPHLAPWHRSCFLASILGPCLPPDVGGAR